MKNQEKLNLWNEHKEILKEFGRGESENSIDSDLAFLYTAGFISDSEMESVWEAWEYEEEALRVLETNKEYAKLGSFRKENLRGLVCGAVDSAMDREITPFQLVSRVMNSSKSFADIADARGIKEDEERLRFGRVLDSLDCLYVSYEQGMVVF